MSTEMILMIVMLLLTALAAGAWAKAKKALSETRDVLQVVVNALADDKVDNAEIAAIAKEAKECGQSWAEFGNAVADLFRKKA